MLETDLELLISAAQDAGEIATGYHKGSYDLWEKSDGAGPVTAADLAVNEMLEKKLKQARPEYGWLSEESAPESERLSADRVFIIDPIDGTRSFIEGSDTWAHSLAIAEHGKVVAGAVYLPKRDLLFTAELNGGAFLNGKPISCSPREMLDGAQVLAARPTLAAHHWLKVPDISRHHRPSLAYRLALTAEGKFDAMLTLRATWEWDVAAGVIITQEAGGKTTDRHGSELVFNNEDPRLAGVVAGNAALHSEIMNALR